jgi:hypothetical protein
LLIKNHAWKHRAAKLVTLKQGYGKIYPKLAGAPLPSPLRLDHDSMTSGSLVHDSRSVSSIVSCACGGFCILCLLSSHNFRKTVQEAPNVGICNYSCCLTCRYLRRKCCSSQVLGVILNPASQFMLNQPLGKQSLGRPAIHSHRTLGCGTSLAIQPMQEPRDKLI